MIPVFFSKMHGLGNDFVVIDARTRPLALSVPQVRAICHRRSGVGCDQLIVIEKARGADTCAFMRIYNADGGEVGACGNATRCVASLIMRELATDRLAIETQAGILSAAAAGGGQIRVDMGPARTQWADIPLAEARDTLHLDVAAEALGDAVAVSVGNPHAVFFVDDAEAVALERIGPQIESHPLFPQATNVEIVQAIDRYTLRVRVWERGVGVTLACGSGACAAAVAARRRDLSEARVDVVMDGGRLAIEWRADGHVTMTGPVALPFRGILEPALLEAGPDYD
jgi:diaminopimelate epimerase